MATSSLRAQTTAPASAPTSQRAVDLAATTLVSLDLRGADIHDATRAFAEQSGSLRTIHYATSAQRGSLPPITLRVERQPYLVALTRLFETAGVAPNNFQPGGLWLAKAPSTQPTQWNGPAHVSGPFLVIAQGVAATRNVSVTPDAKPDDAPHLMLQFLLLAEPKVTVVGMAPWVRVTEAADESGASLVGAQQQLANPPQPPHWQDRTPGPGDTFAAVLDPGHPVGKRIATFKGAIDLKVVSASDTIRLDDVATPRDGMTVRGYGLKWTPLAPRGRGHGGETTLTLDRGEVNDDTWRAFTQLASASQFQVLDAQGRVLPFNGWEAPMTQPKQWMARLRVRPDGKAADGTPLGPPATLMWELPVAAKEVEVPMEFTDLPLP